jgi:predicted transposase/invertase (TIGR01784 family)
MQKTKVKLKAKLSKYMNLLNDWGFKHVFKNENYLIHFLNSVLQGKEAIKHIVYLPTEQLGKTEEDRKAIFDVYCKNDRGELILLEMQNLPQAYFEDRALFYSTFPVRDQAVKGDWDFKLKSVYIIGILNFIPNGKEDGNYIERISLIDEQTQKPFSDKLNFIYIILPKFNRIPEELKADLDYWLYTLKHSRYLKSQPEEIQGNLFCELYEYIQTKQLKGENMEAYRNSELKYEDLHNFTSYAEQMGMEKGRKEGLMEGKYQVSKKLLEIGLSISDISKATGLTPQQIRQMN